MAKITFDMVLAYAKVFDLPEDKRGLPGDLDHGDAKSSEKWLRELAKNPVATVDAYFTSEEDIGKLLEHPNFEDLVVNPQTKEESTRIKNGDPELGIGKFIKLKRKFNDTVEFVDNKTGDLKTIDKGGSPTVKILDTTGEESVFVEYDYNTLGSPANGTLSKVRFELYGKGATRLEALGITELVQYVPGDDSEQEDF